MTKSFIVTMRDSTTEEELAAFKQKIIDQGGKIGHEYNIIKGFSASVPDDFVGTLESDENVKGVEEDGEVHTQ